MDEEVLKGNSMCENPDTALLKCSMVRREWKDF